MAAEQAQETIQSLLIADCGSINTTVALFDRAGDAYRLIARAAAPTTASAPWLDITEGVQRAIGQITEITGRILLNERGVLIRPMRKDGTGVDQFAAVVSAGQPLETLLVGLFDEVSIASARRVLHTVYAHEVDTFSLLDTRNEQQQLTAMVKKQPDLIFLVGGTDGGATQRLLKQVETVGLGLDILTTIKQAQVLYAGNTGLREQVANILGEKVSLHVAANVRPSLELEQLQEAVQLLGALYEEIKLDRLPGIQELSEWGNYPLLPTARAFANMAVYFAALQKGKVLAVDLGSNSVTFISASPTEAHLAIQSDLGMGRPVLNVLQKTKPGNITRWLPIETSPDDVNDFVYHKAIHPQTVPMTETELYLEQAVTREVLRCAMMESAASLGVAEGQLPPFRLLLLHGSTFAYAPNPAQATLMLLDALQPTGLFAIALDQHGILPALGAISAHQPLVVVQALEAGLLTDFGWVIAPKGVGYPGQKVAQIEVKSDEGFVKLDVEYGKIDQENLLLRPGKTAEVTIKPTKRFDIGFGPGVSKKVTLHGGVVGLVVDARGRPLSFPRDESERQDTIRKWRWDIGG